MPADDDDQLEEDQEQEESEENLPGLRKAARAGKKALDENASLKRELLFAKAGIDTESKLGSMLLKTFDGDDLDVLKAEATEIGLLKPAGEPGPDPARVAEDAARQAIQDALPGGAPSGDKAPEGEHPADKMLLEYQTDIRAGVDESAARADGMSKLLAAGASGDKRVFIDKAKHNAEAEEFNRLAMARPRG